MSNGVAKKLTQWGHSIRVRDDKRDLQGEGQSVDGICLLCLGLWNNALSFSLIQLVK